MGQPARSETEIGVTGPEVPAETGVGDAVALGAGVAPPSPPDGCEADAEAAASDGEDEGCGVGCNVVAEGDGLADCVGMGEWRLDLGSGVGDG